MLDLGRSRTWWAVVALMACELDGEDLDPAPPAASGAPHAPEVVAFSGGERGDGTTGAQPPVECASACDCGAGLGCVDGSCVAGPDPVFCCDDPACPVAQLCEDRGGILGRCPEARGNECVSACDCPTLVACLQGFCTPSEQPAYCCTDPFCPDGSACDDPFGTPGTCFVDLTTGL